MIKNPRFILALAAAAAFSCPSIAQETDDDLAAAIIQSAEICNASIVEPVELVAGCTAALNNIEMPELRSLILIRRGIAALELGEAEAAKSDARAALLLEPDRIAAWKLLGDAETAAGRMIEAISAYGAILATDPRNQDALVARATANHALGFDGRCIVDLDTVLIDGIEEGSIDGPKATALALRGMCRTSQGDAQAGISDLEKVLAVADVPAVRAALSDALLSSGQTEKAYAAAERAVAQDATDVSALQALVAAMMVDGRSGEAMQRLTDIAEENADSASINNVLAWISYLSGDVEKAVETISPFAEEDDPQIQDTLGHVHIALGEKEEAMEAFVKVLDLGGYVLAEQYRSHLAALGIEALDGHRSTVLQGIAACIDELAGDCKLYDPEDYPWLDAVDE